MYSLKTFVGISSYLYFFYNFRSTSVLSNSDYLLANRDEKPSRSSAANYLLRRWQVKGFNKEES